MGLTLIKNVHCYTPENVGKKDILIGGEEIIAMDDQIDIQFTDMKVIDGTGKMALPGFIDNHVHIIGGGGEAGFSSRTPELHISDAIQAGVTTVVGVIGTDGTTRLMASLVAKARGLEEQGMTAFVHTGNYQVPVRTCTGSITDDIILIDKIIGSGEIAISDHRSSQPTINELAKIASETRVGGMLAGKAGVVNIHVGDGKDGLHLLRQIVQETEIPITQFLPTHINRNPSLFQEGIDYALAGGYVDFTTSMTPEFIEEGEVPATKAVKKMLGAGVSIDAMTMSSDAQGSLPNYNDKGELVGFNVAPIDSLYASFKELVLEAQVPLEDAIKTVSTNPANILKLKKKGQIKAGMDADILLLEPNKLEIEKVIAKGKVLL